MLMSLFKSTPFTRESFPISFHRNNNVIRPSKERRNFYSHQHRVKQQKSESTEYNRHTNIRIDFISSAFKFSLRNIKFIRCIMKAEPRYTILFNIFFQKSTDTMKFRIIFERKNTAKFDVGIHTHSYDMNEIRVRVQENFVVCDNFRILTFRG